MEFCVQSSNTPLVTIAHQNETYEPEYLQVILSKINEASHLLIAFSDYGELKGSEKVYSNSLLKAKRMLLHLLSCCHLCKAEPSRCDFPECIFKQS